MLNARKLALVGVLLAMFAGGAAYGLIEEKHLSPTLRTRVLTIPSFPVPGATDVTVNVKGVVLPVVMQGSDGGTYVDGGFTYTDGGFADGGDAGTGSAIDGGVTNVDGGVYAEPTATGTWALPYPAKVSVILVDTGGATSAALTCASVTLYGYDQWGQSVYETVSSVTETAKYTTNVFSVITKYVTSRCANGADTGDILRFGQSAKLGLGVHVRQVADVVSYCLNHSGTETCATASNLQGQVSVPSSTVDLSATTPAVADTDSLSTH